MVEKRVEMELYPFDDLWGDLSFVDKETSGVVCRDLSSKRPLGWFVVCG